VHKNGVLHIKKERVLDKRAIRGSQGAAGNGVTDNDGPVYKEIRPVKLDFSATNFSATVTGWRLSIEKKLDALFPSVCVSARGIARIAPASDAIPSQSEDPQILARANLPSEDEEDTSESAEHEKDNTQVTTGGDSNYHGDNYTGGDGGDGGNGDDDRGDDDDDRGDDDDDGGDDADDDGDDDDDGRDDNGSASEREDDGYARGSINLNEPEDEEITRINGNDYSTSDHHNANNTHYGETEEGNYASLAEGSDLTEITYDSESNLNPGPDVRVTRRVSNNFKVVSAPAGGTTSSRKKGVRRGRN